MANLTVRTTEGTYSIPEEDLAKYSVEEDDVAGFGDPFGKIDRNSLALTGGLTLQLGSQPFTVEGTRIVFSAETMTGQTAVR